MLSQLMRDARYYGAVVVEEEGSMCAVVLATKLAEVWQRPVSAFVCIPAGCTLSGRRLSLRTHSVAAGG